LSLKNIEQKITHDQFNIWLQDVLLIILDVMFTDLGDQIFRHLDA
jgi:hypothetical protein